jgi:hypothetical protein
MFQLESMKSKIGFGKKKLTMEQIDKLQKLKKWHSERYLLCMHIVQFMFIVLICLPIFATDPQYCSAGYGCRIGVCT